MTAIPFATIHGQVCGEVNTPHYIDKESNVNASAGHTLRLGLNQIRSLIK